MSHLVTKPTKWHVRPVKTQISLGIRLVWSESSLFTQWVAKDPSFLHADSKDSDQTGQMPRLIWVFAGRTCHFVGFVTKRLKLFQTIQTTNYVRDRVFQIFKQSVIPGEWYICMDGDFLAGFFSFAFFSGAGLGFLAAGSCIKGFYYGYNFAICKLPIKNWNLKRQVH